MVHFLFNSEDKVDRIDLRLKGIEDDLKKLACSAWVPLVEDRICSTPPDSTSNDEQAIADDFSRKNSTRDDMTLSGDYALKKQSVHAGEFLENVVMARLATTAGSRSPMSTAVMNLRGLVERQRRRSHGMDGDGNAERFPLQRAVPSGGLCRLPLPPIATVLQVLNGIMSMTNFPHPAFQVMGIDIID